MIEDRLVGIKSREIYEVPGAITLITAHRDLEDLTLEKELAEFKRVIEGRYAQLVYNGQWFGPLKRAFDRFIDDANRAVNGEVRIRLHKGSAVVVGRRSDDSALYDFDLEAPVLRVGGFDTPYPPAKLEEEYLPDADRILEAVDKVLAY